MMIVAVGSKNEKKINAVRKALALYNLDFSVIGVGSESGVSPQPRGDDIFRGAKNRALLALKSENADFGAGLESGILDMHGKKLNTVCCLIMDRLGEEHVGYGDLFEVPEPVLKAVENGAELSDAVDNVYSIKESRYHGLISIVTKGVFDREKMLTDAVVLAFGPFLEENAGAHK